MSRIQNIGFVVFLSAFMIMLFYPVYHLNEVVPEKIEICEIQLEIDGISVQPVTINSPNVYFEIESYSEFKRILRDNNLTEVNYYAQHYYIFNEDYTLAWRIHYSRILGLIKTH